MTARSSTVEPSVVIAHWWGRNCSAKLSTCTVVQLFVCLMTLITDQGNRLFQSSACFKGLIWEQVINFLVCRMLEKFDERAVGMMLHHQYTVRCWGKQFDSTPASSTKVSAGSSKQGRLNDALTKLESWKATEVIATVDTSFDACHAIHRCAACCN